MCGMCGVYQGGAHWASVSMPESGHGLQRQRYILVDMANAVLEPFHLSVSDFQGQSFVLSSPTGAMELVDNITGLWSVVERLLGYPLDPLAMFTEGRQ